LARLGRSPARQSHMLSRRSLLGIGAVLFSSSPEARARRRLEYDEDEWLFGNPPDQSQFGSSGFYDDWYIGSIPDRPFPIPVVDPRRVDPKWRPQIVAHNGAERPGTILIRPQERLLYLVQPNRTARRYGIGVGRQGFEWSGTAQIKRKEKWPPWRPPAEMLRRRPDLPEFMEGGMDNPLGARALYLFQGERDTLYRIHGTNEPSTIGQAVSSGCIRLLNEDVYDLYNRVLLGTLVKVQSGRRVPVEDEDGEG
jgi:lipoprotein-anchoring transpeptidase ErfK/SrfK